MPLYEYQCQECGEVHEVVRRFSDPPYTICASCGGALKKLISAPAIQFKGSGFYITDYGKGNGGSSKANESAGKSEGNSEGSSKSEGSPSKGEGSSSKSEGSSSKTESSSRSEGSSSKSDRAPAGTKV